MQRDGREQRSEKQEARLRSATVQPSKQRLPEPFEPADARPEESVQQAVSAGRGRRWSETADRQHAASQVPVTAWHLTRR